jgi:ATP-dependent DNA helicase RecG
LAQPNTGVFCKLSTDESLRGKIIADILRDYGYIDGRGMGVRTKVIPSMRSLNKTDPLFEATEDYVKTTLPRKMVESE